MPLQFEAFETDAGQVVCRVTSGRHQLSHGDTGLTEFYPFDFRTGQVGAGEVVAVERNVG